MISIRPYNNAGREDCAYWDNFLTQEDINFILDSPSWAHTETAKIGIGSNESAINNQIRRTDVGWFDFTANNQEIWNKIGGVIWEVNRTFFQFDLTGCYEPAQLGIYRSTNQGHYDWHIDASIKSPMVPRKLSMVIALSDPADYAGGELQIMDSNEPQTLEMPLGRAWFFPSWLLHRVTPVTAGTRKTLALWIGGPGFR